MRGGFTLRVTMVRENGDTSNRGTSTCPGPTRSSTLQWEHFVSKLEPGQKETWTAVISGHDAKKAVAEMVAALYDASLDAYTPHNWQSGFGVFRQDWSRLNEQFENMARYFNQLQGYWPMDQRPVQMTYRSLPSSITVDLWGYSYFGLGGMAKGEGRMMFRSGGCFPARPLRGRPCCRWTPPASGERWGRPIGPQSNWVSMAWLPTGRKQT